MLPDVRNYLSSLTKALEVGPFRLFLSHSKAMLQALLGQALWVMSKVHSFEGEWGHPMRLILTFWDAAALNSPAVLAVKVRQPAMIPSSSALLECTRQMRTL